MQFKAVVFVFALALTVAAAPIAEPNRLMNSREEERGCTLYSCIREASEDARNIEEQVARAPEPEPEPEPGCTLYSCTREEVEEEVARSPEPEPRRRSHERQSPSPSLYRSLDARFTAVYELIHDVFKNLSSSSPHP
uniref:Uncharacterized protein n=1 Tax=Mycena chlorophos TaxID=658473 RepID=A0ABQ0M6L8_MYCCL|nr:predicted protein [Mycena chlorophos]